MDLIWILVLVVVIIALFGGRLYGPGYAPYASGGYGLGGILLIILIILLLRPHL